MCGSELLEIGMDEAQAGCDKGCGGSISTGTRFNLSSSFLQIATASQIEGMIRVTRRCSAAKCLP